MMLGLGRCLKFSAFSKAVTRLTFTSCTSQEFCLTRNISNFVSHQAKISYTNGLLNKSGCYKGITSPLPVSLMHQKRRGSAQPQKPSTSTETYTELYLINNIRFFRLLCRFSRYSFLTFLLGSPLCIAFSFSEAFSIEVLRAIFAGLALNMILLTGQSFIFSSRIVAKIMISPNRDMVKISHLSLFGNRSDIYLKPSDIIPFQDFGGGFMSKQMVVLKFKKPCKKLVFLPGHGGIDTNYHALELLLCSDSKDGE